MVFEGTFWLLQQATMRNGLILVGGPSWNLICMMTSFLLQRESHGLGASFNLIISYFLDALDNLIIVLYLFAASLFYSTFW